MKSAGFKSDILIFKKKGKPMHFPDFLKNVDVKSTRFGVLIFVRFGVLTFLAHWETHNEHISHWIPAAKHKSMSASRPQLQARPSRRQMHHGTSSQLWVCTSSSGRGRILGQYMHAMLILRKLEIFLSQKPKKKRSNLSTSAPCITCNSRHLATRNAHAQKAPLIVTLSKWRTV